MVDPTTARWRYAVHEAGHGLLVVYCGGRVTRLSALWTRTGLCTFDLATAHIDDPEMMGLILIAGGVAECRAGLPLTSEGLMTDLTRLHGLATQGGFRFRRYLEVLEAEADRILDRCAEQHRALAERLYRRVWMDEAECAAALAGITARHPWAIQCV